MFVVSVVCCAGRGLCDGLITRPEESYRMWHVVVWSRNLVNEEALAHWGLWPPPPPKKKRERKRKETLCLKWDVNQRLSFSSVLLNKSYANVLTLSLNIGLYSMQIAYVHNTAASITAQGFWSTIFRLNMWINMNPIYIRAIFFMIHRSKHIKSTYSFDHYAIFLFVKTQLTAPSLDIHSSLQQCSYL